MLAILIEILGKSVGRYKKNVSSEVPMANDSNRGESFELVFAVLAALCGWQLIRLVDSEVLATEIALAIAFVVNIAAVYASQERTKKTVRKVTATFLLGACGAVLMS